MGLDYHFHYICPLKEKKEAMYKATVNNEEFQVEVEKGKNRGTIDSKDFSLDILNLSKDRYHIIKNDKSYTVEVLDINRQTKDVKLKINGEIYEVKLKDEFDALLANLGIDMTTEKKETDLKAPMPGLVIDVMVKPGDEISTKQPLLILEAMKMENVLKSPIDGVVKTIKVEKTNTVEKNEVLIEFE